ncbi:MAG: creatininase family protein [Nocardioidaceae bacterium]
MTEAIGGQHLAAMTQPEAARALARGTAILVSGSVEQHGGHLPLGTDAYAALTVAERVAQRINAPILPLSPVGVAPYHLPWPGSLTLRPDTFRRLLFDVCEGLVAAGVTRVIIVNWHEGNTPSIRLGADEVQQRLPVRVVVVESHIITNGLYPDEMEFTHAGAMETAAVLAYQPSLVQLDQLTPGSPVDAGNEGHALFRRRDIFPILRDFREVAPNGWYGSPDRVGEERAAEIFDAVADYIVEGLGSVLAALSDFSDAPSDSQEGR